VGIGFTFISKTENGKLAFADYPGEALIVKLAKALDADADELLILAKKYSGQDQEAGSRTVRGIPQARRTR
jgi:transcriptional regulator with XRE-family HTH domain